MFYKRFYKCDHCGVNPKSHHMNKCTLCEGSVKLCDECAVKHLVEDPHFERYSNEMWLKSLMQRHSNSKEMCYHCKNMFTIANIRKELLRFRYCTYCCRTLICPECSEDHKFIEYFGDKAERGLFA